MPSPRVTIDATLATWISVVKSACLGMAILGLVASWTPALAQNEFPSSASAQAAPKPQHGIAIHGEPKYPPDFKHFNYVNPDAPKGGTAKLSWFGSFDSLNPYIVRGSPAIGLGLIYETLMISNADEPNSVYGLIAESLEVPEDRSWAIFNLRPEARFYDGTPITADDVVFSMNILKTKGSPRSRFYYASVEKVEKLGERRVKFTFKPGDNRELPIIVGGMVVLSKTYWEKRDFERSTIEPPLTSGPYRIESLEPGRSIVYRRDPNYWGAKLPVNIGRHNFDVIRYDYFRDTTVALEAFKAGEFDLREENTAKNWATAYDIAAVRQGLIKKEQLGEESQPPGLQGYFFNIRRPIFADRRVREAIGYAFDFEWANRQLFYGSYTRTKSYYSQPGLSAVGLPEGEELAILERYRDRVPAEVFTKEFEPPNSDGEGGIRANLLTALGLLKEAGWEVNNKGVLVNRASGEPMSFEILLNQPGLERLTGPFLRNLKRLGINASMRTVDTSQYTNRTNEFDFDMTMMIIPQSSSPGNEQREFFSSESAKAAGSYNVAGISDPVVDELIELLIAAPDRESLEARTRALDRVLLWGFYNVPNYHLTGDRIVYWDKFGHPATIPARGYQFDTWWIDQAHEANMAKNKAAALLQEKAARENKPAAQSHMLLYILAAAAGLIALLIVRRRRRNTGDNS